MKEFKTFHPIVSFVYFAFVIAFTMIYMHPLCLIISVICGFVFRLMMTGKAAVRFFFSALLPLMLVSAIINPLFNHEGITILAYFPNGNPLTLQSAVYGVASAMMLCGSILWFFCFSEIMTRDKILYLSGRLAPSLALLFSMILRFVPEFKEQIKKVAAAQKMLGEEKGKIRQGLKILSVMVSYTLENAVTTAESMKSRGYGKGKRSCFSDFKFTPRDGVLLIITGILALWVIAAEIRFDYFPDTVSKTMRFDGFLAYFILFALPIIIEIQEEIRWKLLKYKI